MLAFRTTSSNGICKARAHKIHAHIFIQSKVYHAKIFINSSKLKPNAKCEANMTVYDMEEFSYFGKQYSMEIAQKMCWMSWTPLVVKKTAFNRLNFLAIRTSFLFRCHLKEREKNRQMSGVWDLRPKNKQPKYSLANKQITGELSSQWAENERVAFMLNSTPQCICLFACSTDFEVSTHKTIVCK